jgi:predicted nucleic acid-binding protein
VELFKHRQRIVDKSDASEDEILRFVNSVIQKVHFFNEELISISNFIEAVHLCKGIDEDDTPYIALSLEIDAPIWTRDEILKNGLRLKGRI